MPGEVIRKKLLTRQKAMVEGGPGVDRGWRVAFARAARDMMELPVDFVSVTLARMSLAELLDLPPERALILMLEGPEDGLGLVILSPDLLSALTEVLTIGKCGASVPESRKPTRTDAAMLSPLADLALSHLEEALARDADLIWTSGFRFASFLEEARPLGLLLEDVTYRTLSARLSLAHGMRVGDLILVLPAEGRGCKPLLNANKVPDAVARPAFAAALTARVDAATCQIEAVLARLSMPLAEVMGLSVDRVLALPSAALDRISLEGMDSRQVAEGKLGQHRGMRAIRLTSERTGAGAEDRAMVAPTPAPLPAGDGSDWAVEPFAAEAEEAFDFAGFSATGTD